MRKLFWKIVSWFKGPPSPPPPAVQPLPIAIPTAPDNETKLRDLLVDYWKKDLGQFETDGSNRSEMIDSINRRLKVPLGSPYCIGGLLVRGVEALCKQLSLVNPIPMTAGTQNFYNLAPLKYRNPIGKGLAKKGDIGILVNKYDAGHGHAFGFREDETEDQQLTVEYNTDKAGSRNGDGVHELTRLQSGTLTKRYRGSVDVVKMILDANKEMIFGI